MTMSTPKHTRGGNVDGQSTTGSNDMVSSDHARGVKRGGVVWATLGSDENPLSHVPGTAAGAGKPSASPSSGSGKQGGKAGVAVAPAVPRMDTLKRSVSTRSVASGGRANHLGCCGSDAHHAVAARFRLLRDHPWFQASIILVIFVAGIQVGIQTYNVPAGSQLAEVLETLDSVVMVIFIAEIVIKLIAEGRKPWLFFTDGWNCFDFAIVAVGLMPFGGNAVTALRLIRLLRVLKLVRALPKLRLLVMGLLQSMSSIAYIGLLLGMLFYLYAVVGVSMFGGNDPVHMGSLHITLLTLFRCSTLEDWSDIMYIATTGCENWGYEGIEWQCVNSEPKPVMGILYFCTFVVLANMMILNLFIGVITTSMAEAKEALEEEMVAEQQEKARQKRVLLGLPSESEEEEEDVDGAIVHSINRIEYLLHKCDSKAAKFQNALEKACRGSPLVDPLARTRSRLMGTGSGRGSSLSNSSAGSPSPRPGLGGAGGPTRTSSEPSMRRAPPAPGGQAGGQAAGTGVDRTRNNHKPMQSIPSSSLDVGATTGTNVSVKVARAASDSRLRTGASRSRSPAERGSGREVVQVLDMANLTDSTRKLFGDTDPDREAAS